MSPAEWGRLLGAIGMLVLAGALMVLEFTVVSWGALSLAAIAAVILGVVLAFSAGQLAGWLYLLLIPVAAWIAMRMGVRTMRATGMVVEAQSRADAGYGHAASAAGVAPGARGELVTDAIPSGRARFPGGELDIQVSGASLPRGTPVVVLRIEGPVVLVSDAR